MMFPKSLIAGVTSIVRTPPTPPPSPGPCRPPPAPTPSPRSATTSVLSRYFKFTYSKIFAPQWNLPLPTDMSDARAALVSRAIYIRSFMERSRGDIKQWSWVWEKEIQNIEVTLSIYHF